MEYGVYSKSDYEIAISSLYCLVFYKENNVFGTKLYRDELLIAVCEHNTETKKTAYAFMNNKNENIFNDSLLCSILNEKSNIISDDDLSKKDEIKVIPVETQMPTVSEKGIAYCLKNWKLGNQLNIFDDAINFTMNTNKFEYVMMIRKTNEDIYCGASVTVPFDYGLFGGQQYFRIRNHTDNTQPWCGFHCYLGNDIAIPDFQNIDCSDGKCVVTNHGIYWGVQKHTDDEIILQGCGDDEYFYYRDAYMTERFMP